MEFETIAERILTAYSWALASALLLFLYGIARFYQHMAGERSHFRLFLFPFALLALAGLRYAWIGGVSGDWLGDVFFCLGGISLLALGIHLERLMMGRRHA